MKYIHTFYNFLGKRMVCAHKLLKQQPKSPFSFVTLHLHEDIDQAVTFKICDGWAQHKFTVTSCC